MLKEIFSFPETVNEYAARTVATFVLLLALTYLMSENVLILSFMAYGFAARVTTGPSLSPLALLATKLIVPAMGNPAMVCPGPPKRFAQAIGLAFTGIALTCALYRYLDAAYACIVILALFAALEAAIGFCAGCWMFRQLMQRGWIPQEVCDKCNNISLNYKNDS